MPVSNSCEAVETCGVHKNQCCDHKQSFRGIALKMHSKTTIADFLRQYYALKNMTKGIVLITNPILQTTYAVQSISELHY